MGLAQAEMDDNTITVVISCFFILSDFHFIDLFSSFDDIDTWLQSYSRASSCTGENLAIEIIDRCVSLDHHGAMKHLELCAALDLIDSRGNELNVDGVAVL